MLSVQSIAALVLYFGNAGLSAREFIYIMYYFPQDFQFDLFIWLSIEICYYVLLLSYPLCLWTKSGSLKNLINDWFQYQVKYLNFTCYITIEPQKAKYDQKQFPFQTKFCRMTGLPLLLNTAKNKIRLILSAFTVMQFGTFFFIIFYIAGHRAHQAKTTVEDFRMFLAVMEHTSIILYWCLISQFHNATADTFLLAVEVSIIRHCAKMGFQ